MDDAMEKELLALTVEIFETTYGLLWQDAIAQAKRIYANLCKFAVEWDTQADAEREVISL